MDSVLLTVQLLITGALVGLCGTVQLAVYARFGALIGGLGADAFRTYHAAYTRAMGWIAAPLMLVELGLAVAWLFAAPHAVPTRVGLGLVAAIWLLTFGLIVPVHTRLQRSPQQADARRLTRLNGVRTLLWMARAVLLVWVA